MLPRVPCAPCCALWGLRLVPPSHSVLPRCSRIACTVRPTAPTALPLPAALTAQPAPARSASTSTAPTMPTRSAALPPPASALWRPPPAAALTSFSSTPAEKTATPAAPLWTAPPTPPAAATGGAAPYFDLRAAGVRGVWCAAVAVAERTNGGGVTGTEEGLGMREAKGV